MCAIGRSGRKALHPDMGYMKGLSSDVSLSGLVETFQVKKKIREQRVQEDVVVSSRASGSERAGAFGDTAGPSDWSVENI